MKKRTIILSVGIFIGVLGASLLVCFGILYLKPYLQVRTMEEGECEVVLQDPTEHLVTCMCAPDRSSSCHSKYPCLRLKVVVYSEQPAADGSKEKIMENVTMYDSYETFLLQRNAMQCSYHKCNRVVKKNLEALEYFVRHYGDLGKKNKCYFEPSDTTYAILHVVTKVTVVHTLLWPSVAVVVGLTILFANVFRVGLGPPVTETVRSAAVIPPDRLRARLNDNRYKRVLAT